MSSILFLKKPSLTDFTRVFESCIEIGKDMTAIVARHFIKGLIASLGQDDGIGGLDCCKIISIGLPSRAKQIFICLKAGVI
jgi:hypothetical protein